MNAARSVGAPLVNDVLHVTIYMRPVTTMCGVTYGTAPVRKVSSSNPVHVRSNKSQTLKKKKNRKKEEKNTREESMFRI